MSLTRTVAVIEVIAGGVGLVFASALIWPALTVFGGIGDPLLAVAFLLGLAFFSLNVWAGLELWHERAWGFNLSIAAWVIQIPQVLSPFACNFLAGPYLTFRISSRLDLGFDFGAQTAFMLSAAGRSGWHVGLNIVAVCVVLLLVRLKSEWKEECGLLESIAQEEHRRAMNAA